MTQRHTPPDDVLSMPRDPRWREEAGYLHLHCMGSRPDAGIWIPPGPEQQRMRAELDWWKTYRAALAGMARLKAALKATKKKTVARRTRVPAEAAPRGETTQQALWK